MDSVKFVFVHLYNDRSGSPKILRDVLSVARECGIKFDLLTSGHVDGFLSDVPCSKSPLFYKRSRYKFLNIAYFFFSQLHLFLKSLAYKGENVVFYINTMMPFAAGLAAICLGKKCIYHIHETSVRPKIFKLFVRRIIRRSASLIIFPSNYLMRTEGFDGIEQFVIYNSVVSINDKMFELLARARKNNTFTVLMACSLKQYKGVGEFLTLAKKMSNLDLTFKLVLNAEMPEIEQYFEGFEKDCNIVVLPRQTDMDSHFREASLLLNLSRPNEWIETFGLTLLEAMSFGLPVIAPPLGGPVEIVIDGENGFLVSCYDLAKIENTIVRLFQDEIFYDEISRAALMRSRDFSKVNFELSLAGVLRNFRSNLN